MVKSGTAGKNLLSIGMGAGVTDSDANTKVQVGYTASFQKYKKSHEVKKIFKGKYATICDECVELCEEIIEEEVEERIKGGIDMRSTSSDLMCSFCARLHIDPDLFILIAGPGKYICDKCALVFADELKFI